MSDIMKFILEPQTAECDPEGNLAALGDAWSAEQASRLAEEEGIELTAEHWEVISWLRDRYRHSEREFDARKLSQRMSRRFASRGGRRYLYGLFPHGPLHQGCRLAGIPEPHHTVDRGCGCME